MSDIFNKLLDEVSKEKKESNFVQSKFPQLAKDIEKFLDLKLENDSRVEGLTLRWFYTKKLKEAHGGPSQYSTISRFVSECLKRNPETGEHLTKEFLD
jgi:hypothetical protein